MKLRKIFKLFSVVAFLILGCGFSAFAAQETFKVGEQAVAKYEFKEGKDFGIGMGLVVYWNMPDPTQSYALMDQFAEYIRERCRHERIDLEIVITQDLVYHIRKNADPRKKTPDLVIEVNPTCTDFVVKKWALTALNCTTGLSRQCDGKSKPYMLITPTAHGYEARRMVDVSYTNTVWGTEFDNVIIADPRVKPRTYYDFRYMRGGKIETATEAAGWYALFGSYGSCKCVHFILYGKSIAPRDLPCK